MKSQQLPKDMEKIVEEKTNIPVGELKAQEQAQLKNLASDLEQHVIGQMKQLIKLLEQFGAIASASIRPGDQLAHSSLSDQPVSAKRNWQNSSRKNYSVLKMP